MTTSSNPKPPTPRMNNITGDGMVSPAKRENKPRASGQGEIPTAVRDKFAQVKAAGGEPRFYINKHGQAAVINVANIGKSRAPRASPQATNIALRARIQSLEMELAVAQERINELLAANEMLGQSLT